MVLDRERMAEKRVVNLDRLEAEAHRGIHFLDRIQGGTETYWEMRGETQGCRIVHLGHAVIIPCACLVHFITPT